MICVQLYHMTLEISWLSVQTNEARYSGQDWYHNSANKVCVYNYFLNCSYYRPSYRLQQCLANHILISFLLYSQSVTLLLLISCLFLTPPEVLAVPTFKEFLTL